MLFCIAYDKPGAVIWYDNGIERYITELERRGSVTKKVEYSMTCQLSKIWHKNTTQGV